MEITIDFPGGARVDADFGPHRLYTDQPSYGGGEDSAPTPLATFLCAVGASAGSSILRFCHQRGIPTEGLRLVQNVDVDPVAGLVRAIQLDIELPEDFPERYREEVIGAAEQCLLKRHLEQPPAFAISAVARELVFA